MKYNANGKVLLWGCGALPHPHVCLKSNHKYAEKHKNAYKMKIFLAYILKK